MWDEHQYINIIFAHMYKDILLIFDFYGGVLLKQLEIKHWIVEILRNGIGFGNGWCARLECGRL
jgi:hypothetical protein